MTNPLKKLDGWLTNLSSITLMSVAAGVILLVGIIRCISGTEYALSVFFMFPIVFIAWYAGTIPGVFMAFFSTVVWLFADLYLRDEFSTPEVPFINETFRLIVFLFVVLLMGTLKNALDTQKKIARTDILTGMANRLAFFETADMEIRKARRFDDPVSIVYIDIDNFKRVNDTQGHAEGDRLLKKAAETIMHNIREIDLAARIGGDEIGLLLVKTDITGAVTLAEKLKDRLDAQMQQQNWPVTFSMGVATFPRIQASVGDMMNVADRLMYFAKKQGKNRIVQEIFVGRPEGEDQAKSSKSKMRHQPGG